MRVGGEGSNRGKMVGWHHQLNGHEFEQTLGNSEQQGGLACCSPQGRKASDLATEQLSHNMLNPLTIYLTSFISSLHRNSKK